MSKATAARPEQTEEIPGIQFVNYCDESQLDNVMDLVGRDLSEPYSIFTYRYFLHRFPDLCILAMSEHGHAVGCIVGKIDADEDGQDTSGYIGMLTVDKTKRRLGIARALVTMLLERFKSKRCKSVTLETEVSNVAAQKLYQDIFGFIREELLVRYYLNWGDAYRLRLWFCEQDDD